MLTTSARYTMADVRAANKDAGLFFFERSTMRFFRSRIESQPYSGSGGVFFLTSEQFDDRAPRKYTVREFNPSTGDIKTVGAFQAYASKEVARGDMRDLSRHNVKVISAEASS